jgi:hypothetical protein
MTKGTQIDAAKNWAPLVARNGLDPLVGPGHPGGQEAVDFLV